MESLDNNGWRFEGARENGKGGSSDVILEACLDVALGEPFVLILFLGGIGLVEVVLRATTKLEVGKWKSFIRDQYFF